MAIRICTLGGIPAFRHDGLEVSERWSVLETDEITDATRNALRDFHGRFIQVHTEDRDKLTAELGLAFVDVSEPLAEAKKPGKPGKPGKSDPDNLQTDSPGKGAKKD